MQHNVQVKVHEFLFQVFISRLFLRDMVPLSPTPPQPNFLYSLFAFENFTSKALAF